MSQSSSIREQPSMGVKSDANLASDHVDVFNVAGKGGIVLVCEHASNFIPDEFANLGLAEAALSSHIAWDIGALDVAKRLSDILDAPLVAPTVSRLVYDCNRPVLAQSAVPETSGIYEIPGNSNLTEGDRDKRSKQIYQPYRKALNGVIENTLAQGITLAIVTIHSFTPLYKGVQRTMDLGIVFDQDARLAEQFMAHIDQEGSLSARLNEPYGPGDGVTYTLVEHAESRGLLNVMIEIRNDLIRDDASQRAMAEKLGKFIQDSITAVQSNGESVGRS